MYPKSHIIDKINSYFKGKLDNNISSLREVEIRTFIENDFLMDQKKDAYDYLNLLFKNGCLIKKEKGDFVSIDLDKKDCFVK